MEIVIIGPLAAEVDLTPETKVAATEALAAAVVAALILLLAASAVGHR
jgi:hypothetical protein